MRLRRMVADNFIYTSPRLACLKDTSAVFEILQACKSEIPLHNSIDLHQIQKDCKSKLYWIIESEGSIVGAMKLVANEIFYLAVRPEYRKQGNARSLIYYAKKRCSMKRWSHLKIKTRKENIPTICLLETEGFIEDCVALVLDPQWVAYVWRRMK